MKPKDLKAPFSWKTRQVILEDKVFFIPEYYDNYAGFQFPAWESGDLFGNSHPVFVEFCSGNGSWVVQKAEENPEVNWVAVEKRFDRCRKIWAKMKNRGLKNLLIVCGEAETFTRFFVKESSISNVFINFPDPWPKTRHAKHRIMCSEFIQLLGSTMKEESKLTFVTDDPPYCHAVVDVLKQKSFFTPCFPAPYFITHLESYGTSFFEQLWREKGKDIHFIQFQKVIS